jgi:hypothetical protein
MRAGIRTVDIPSTWTQAEILADASERAAIREYDGGMFRDRAEAMTCAEYGLPPAALFNLRERARPQAT